MPLKARLPFSFHHYICLQKYNLFTHSSFPAPLFLLNSVSLMIMSEKHTSKVPHYTMFSVLRSSSCLRFTYSFHLRVLNTHSPQSVRIMMEVWNLHQWSVKCNSRERILQWKRNTRPCLWRRSESSPVTDISVPGYQSSAKWQVILLQNAYTNGTINMWAG